MEFNEKLQQLRKSRGLTQEELAEALYVSRTAVSKWESGRGYPGIDSLKVIANYFTVTIDELLSGEKLLSIAEKENKAKMQNLCSMLIGMIDVLHLLLIILPLYPKSMHGYISAVNLFAYTEAAVLNQMVYWGMFLSCILIGFVEIVITCLKAVKTYKIILPVSMVISILTILFLAMARETYATVLAFLFFLLKSFLYIKASCEKQKSE